MAAGVGCSDPGEAAIRTPTRRIARSPIRMTAVRRARRFDANLNVMSAWAQIEAEKAFGRAARARRRAGIRCRLQRGRTCGCDRLHVHDATAPLRRAAPGATGRREIPVDAINATLEPNRAAHFDDEFRPARPAKARWERVWLAEERGVPLPPISVVPAGDGYAIRDGHHRVSVARARGQATISAVVAAA